LFIIRISDRIQVNFPDNIGKQIKGGTLMDNERLENLTRRFYEEVFNRGNLQAIDELVNQNMLEHQLLPGLPPGREGLRQWTIMFRTAFPDLHADIEDLTIDGDRVWIRSVMRGTNTGQFMGMSPTGKTFQAESIDIIRVDQHGSMVEHWGVFDQAAMMQQLGLAQPSGEQHM
jgi:steroid delta-isomerase-like uncharacterized protein